jgi:hypothetical protein
MVTGKLSTQIMHVTDRTLKARDNRPDFGDRL